LVGNRIAQLAGVIGVLATNPNDLRSRNHRRQHSRIGKVVTGTSVLNRCRHWVPRDNGDGLGMISMIGSKLYDPEGRVGINTLVPVTTLPMRDCCLR
jgi:hypothetical protein